MAIDLSKYNVANVGDIISGYIDNMSDKEIDRDLKLFKKFAKELKVKNYDDLVCLMDNDYTFECGAKDSSVPFKKDTINGNDYYYFRSESDCAKFIENCENKWLSESGDDSISKCESKSLKEGAGAGYTIQCSNFDNIKVHSFNAKHNRDSCIVECDISAVCDVSCESYYYGGKVDNVKVVINEIAIEDYNDSDVTEDGIIWCLKSIGEAEFIIGGGYSHTTFNGVLADTSKYGNVDTNAGFVYSISMMVVNNRDIKYIDDCVTGNNIERLYVVYDYNNDAIEEFDSEDEAIEFAIDNDCEKVVAETFIEDKNGNQDYDYNSTDETVWRNDIEDDSSYWD